ncbi:hypothetical protein K504DRAFT_390164 [Pleomassaria siparia CBS 279.74]|uniref:Uncharacterized protein n=1 Tax=Pleomassaria siparia CBS 279.74 TaxID=1314801 RepID=A0A6G1JWG3_9PLEO|nr:hypothetical protein K504DRAFT_390164 [Pleomassaria siparia CBS 279.74]
MAYEHREYPASRSVPQSPLPPPPPPPPPPPAPPQLQLQTPQTPQTPQTSPPRRIAVQPPLLTTSLAPPQGASFLHGHHTPVSAVSLNVPFSPYTPSPSIYAASPAVSSPMAMRNASSSSSVPYNPQQWGRNTQMGGQYAPHMTQTPIATSRLGEVTGMEAALPSPPPPYSPAQNHTISQAVSSAIHTPVGAFPSHLSHPTSALPHEYASSPHSTPVSGYGSSRPTSVVIPSSAVSITSNLQFPPPPPAPSNGKGRSSSRDILHSKFSLSSFRNRGSDNSPPVPNAIDALRFNTSEAISRMPGSPGLPPQRVSQLHNSNQGPERPWGPESPIRAPASRRAASAGFLGLASETRTPVEYSPSPQQGHWGPSIPLPPPPPGPPPSSSRSQSLGPGRSLDLGSSGQILTLPTPPTRRPGQSTLTPIPPTPVGWHEDPRNRSKSPAAHGLYIDTSPQAVRSQDPPVQLGESEDASVSSGPTVTTSNNSSTLYRSPNKSGKRENSVVGIRERRSESRAARERVEPNNNPWAQDMATSTPNDLVLGTPDGLLNRRAAAGRNTPRSAGTLRTPRSAQLSEDPGSSHTTPRAEVYRRVVPGASAPTPPFSPGTDNFDHTLAQKAPSAAFPTKALPTPPLRYYTDETPSSLTIESGGTDRPPTSQTSLLSNPHFEESATTPRPADRDLFAQASMERHRLFADRESAAQSDQERLELFAEFIVAESRLRRDRYSGAFDAMAGDIVDLTRDLWRSHGSSGRRSVTPSAQSASVPSGRRSQASTVGESPDTKFSNSIPTTAASPASSVTNFTPHTEQGSPSSANSQRARDASWNNNYHPSLSPIPSMAMSTVPDEEDSRGRSASRWWEASNDGASSGVGGGRRLERSKRESKYMSLPKEARESLQWAGETEPSPGLPSGSSQIYGPNEYPAEKTEFHEELQAPPLPSYGYYPNSAPATPDPHRLDVSRLVTLPPPYPRHHPAVNNSHPDLASIRTNLRGLADMAEVKTVKEHFTTRFKTLKDQESASLVDRRAQLRYNVQVNIQNGQMGYDDAAKAEADFEAREQRRAQDAVQSLFDSFQADVANPLHAMFCERITKVTASIEHLRGRLANDAQELNPNQTQEEGDEQPELLEMLTLLKWLFEAREQLHKEMFELEDERNDLYKDIIVLPYIQAKNDQKVQEASVFFSRDAQDRKVVFEKESLKRYEDFMNAIEENVTRGVEAQLSAFWDIAPGLLTVVQKIPQRLQGFEILIPPQEFEENPVYHDSPLQYLYSLLAHAGRSASQFIESQTNLLCLLHEVKTGVMIAGTRLLETQRILEGEDLANVESEMRAIRADEEARLTYDLKDKVGLVESQWGEALGNGLEDCKTRVETFLVNSGGWDESLKD